VDEAQTAMNSYFSFYRGDTPQIAAQKILKRVAKAMAKVESPHAH
jgi:hypothetical protein